VVHLPRVASNIFQIFERGKISPTKSRSEVWFDATRMTPKQTFFQIPLYPSFAHTKFTTHIFYSHSLLERNVAQLFQIKGTALRPHLPFFLLATTTGMLWASWVLPRFHKRWNGQMCTLNWWTTMLVSFLPSAPFLLLANNAWYTCHLTSSVMSFLRWFTSKGKKQACS
jgi:hypothetical protein